AIDSAHGHLQQDTLIEQIAVTNQANPALVNQRAELAATPASGHGTGLRLELDQQGVVGGWATGYGVIAWPESGKINRMHGDSRGQVKGVFGDCQFTCFPDCQLALSPDPAMNQKGGRRIGLL